MPTPQAARVPGGANESIEAQTCCCDSAPGWSPRGSSWHPRGSVPTTDRGPRSRSLLLSFQVKAWVHTAGTSQPGGDRTETPPAHPPRS